MQKYKIAVLPGDGIGEEVCQEALKVLDRIAKKFELHFETQQGLIGGAAWEGHQDHFPQFTKDLCHWSDAVLFGSVGGPVEAQNEPKWHNCERDSILAIRKFLGLTINVRPARVWPQLADLSVLKAEKIPKQGLEIITFRELSEGLYFGTHETQTLKDDDILARDICEYKASTIRHITEFAFEFAKKNNKKIASVDKANVLDTSRLWRKTVEEVAQKYPSVNYENWLVDNCAQQLVKNPNWFEIILTENLFGDILSDLTSTFSGSLGLLASASFNQDGFGMYEPSGGSAPKHAGKNRINPIAQILCVAMMLRYSFGLNQAAQSLEDAVDQTIQDGFRTYDLFREKPQETKVSCSEMGDRICERIV